MQLFKRILKTTTLMTVDEYCMVFGVELTVMHFFNLDAASIAWIT